MLQFDAVTAFTDTICTVTRLLNQSATVIGSYWALYILCKPEQGDLAAVYPVKVLEPYTVYTTCPGQQLPRVCVW